MLAVILKLKRKEVKEPLSEVRLCFVGALVSHLRKPPQKFNVTENLTQGGEYSGQFFAEQLLWFCFFSCNFLLMNKCRDLIKRKTLASSS